MSKSANYSNESMRRAGGGGQRTCIQSPQDHFDRVYRLCSTRFCCITVSFFFSGQAFLDLSWTGLHILPSVLMDAITTLVLVMLIRIFGEISAGGSPLAIRYAKDLSLIGCLLLANYVLNTIASATPSPQVQIGSLTLDLFIPFVASLSLNLGFSFILWAVVCYCFSCASRYGVLLQRLSDDTV